MQVSARVESKWKDTCGDDGVVVNPNDQRQGIVKDGNSLSFYGWPSDGNSVGAARLWTMRR